MVLKIYGNWMSTCTRKVLCTLAEKEQKDFEFINLDFKTGQHKSEEHLERQPFGQVPVLEEIDESGRVFRLYESRAIIRYLDDKFPLPRLSPVDKQERAIMEQWISVEASNVTPPLMKLVSEYLFKPMFGGTANEKVVEESMVIATRALDVYEKQLGFHPYIAGDEFTLADITNLPYFEYLSATPAKSLIESRPNLAAWWKRCSERRSWKVASGKEGV